MIFMPSSKINTRKTFSIFHTNICSLPANSENLEILLEDLEYKFDVISLSETWNPEGKQQNYAPKTLTGYHAYIGTTGNTAKGGCGFYINEEIHYSPRTDLNVRLLNSETKFESCWIEIISRNKPNTLIGVFHRHPRKKDTHFTECISKTLDKIKKEKKRVIVCGDFNFDLLNYDKNECVNSYLNTMLQNSLQPCILEPTRIVANHRSSLVDNIFINTLENVFSGNILEQIS